MHRARPRLIPGCCDDGHPVVISSRGAGLDFLRGARARYASKRWHQNGSRSPQKQKLLDLKVQEFGCGHAVQSVLRKARRWLPAEIASSSLMESWPSLKLGQRRPILVAGLL
jgi:hypothetical protein